MIVGAAQMNLIWHDRSANHKKAHVMAEKAKKEGAELVIFPEMFSTGFSMDVSVTEEPLDGPTPSFLRSLAEELDMAVVGGFVLRSDNIGPQNVSLAIDKEGYDVATWLNTLGIAAIVVRYRTAPTWDDQQKVIPSAEMDARRAIQVTRRRAGEWGVDPAKIGVLGFSAGGFLVASVGTQWDAGDPDAEDPVARVSSRPDFLCLLYSGGREHHRANVTGSTPPAFLAQAADDFVPITNSITFYQALLDAGVAVEMHLFMTGGHGFGLGVNGGAVAAWPELFAEWLDGLSQVQARAAQRRPGLSIESTIEEILADDGGKAVLAKHMPAFLSGPGSRFALTLPLRHIAAHLLSEKVLKAIDEDLADL